MDQDATWYGVRPRPKRHCVRCGPSSPSPKRRQSPQFSVHVHRGHTAAWIKMPLEMEVDLGPGHIVLDGDLAPLPKRGAQPPIFGLWPNGWMDQDATWYNDRLRSGQHCVRCRPSSIPLVAQPPKFRPMSVVAKRLDGSRIKTPLGTKVDLFPGRIVLHGTQSPQSGTALKTHLFNIAFS